MRYPKTFEKSCASIPENVRLWHPSNELTPRQVFIQCCKKFKWNCFDCHHEYDQSPHSKNGAGESCPFCANTRLCEKPECQTCFEKSCASIPENVKLWHLSNKLKPRQVFKRSDTKYNWDCFFCNHIYNQSPHDKNGSGNGCSYCANKELCENPDCQTCFDKSCASLPENVTFWHPSNELTPRQVFKFSVLKILWNCFNCNHDYNMSPKQKNWNQAGCVYCSNKQLCENPDCQTCFLKSCASIPENVKLWHPSNELTPRQVFQFSAKKIKWNCVSCNNNYKSSPASKNANSSGCPVCKHKTEKLIYQFLKSQNIKVEKEFKLQGCTKRYDFLLKDFNLIVSCDGLQHFQDIKYFKTIAKQIQSNDIAKMKKAILQNYSFLRFYQRDVLFNKLNWQQIIKENLFQRTTPTVTYYSKNVNLYDDHKLLMN